LATAQRDLAALEAEVARRAALKMAGYFHDCEPGCQARSSDPADHVPYSGRARPTCRVLYRKHVAFFRAGGQYRQRMFLAGNRTGKTDAASYELVLHLTGAYPAWWEGRRFDTPIEAWAAGDGLQGSDRRMNPWTEVSTPLRNWTL
jgi:hypothetical protein